jgi:hypothetical protein
MINSSGGYMKKSISLTLTDEEIMELQRILLDEDREEAVRFLKKHLDKMVQGVISGKGHCKPWFELPGRSAIPDEFRK